MLYLSRQDLLELLAPTTLVSEIEQGLRDFAAGKVVVPARQHAECGDHTLLTMPVLGQQGVGAKIVSVVPSNGQRGLPAINGLMILNDGTTGVPLAVLDAAMLTAQRTGAVGALGLKYTGPHDIGQLGIIGTGVQATWQAIFACAVLKTHTIHFVARSDEKAQRFSEAVLRYVPSVRLCRCASARGLLAQTDVVIAATSSSEPVVPAEQSLVANKHFVSVGSFKRSMRELPELLYAMAPQVVVDSDAAKHEVGDLVEPLTAGTLRPENIVHIAELVTGARQVDRTRTTVFKSVGMALYDLYAARVFLAEARRLGHGTLLEDEPLGA
jgi:ornithine cyclodeaminase